jgi:DNA-binding response OmpR family regulator
MVTQKISAKNILVVEDEPSISRVCVRTLVGEGHHVETVINGKLAEDTLGQKEFDLYIVDIRTPVMNGIELYQEMRETWAPLAERVLFTTGDTLSSNIKKFLDETGRPYLTKPFTPNELRTLVKIALNPTKSVI